MIDLSLISWLNISSVLQVSVKYTIAGLQSWILAKSSSFDQLYFEYLNIIRFWLNAIFDFDKYTDNLLYFLVSGRFFCVLHISCHMYYDGNRHLILLILYGIVWTFRIYMFIRFTFFCYIAKFIAFNHCTILIWS